MRIPDYGGIMTFYEPEFLFSSHNEFAVDVWLGVPTHDPCKAIRLASYTMHMMP